MAEVFIYEDFYKLTSNLSVRLYGRFSLPVQFAQCSCEIVSKNKQTKFSNLFTNKLDESN